MASYKDILNTFGGDTSYADRYQAAMLKWDTNALSSIANEYKASQWWTASGNTPTTTTYTPTVTYTPTTPQTTWWNITYDKGNGNLGNWNYWDTSAYRQDEIVSNLNQAYAQNPNQFSDWATFAQNFNYDYSWRSDKERETMRNWYQQNVWNQMDYNNANNTDYFLAQLMSWQTLQGTWAAATAAMNRYKDLQSLSAMTPEQIASAISSNSINAVWQSMQDLKNYSPELYAQVQAILQDKTTVDDINSVWTGIYDWLTKTTSNSNYTKYNFTDEYAKNASVIKQYNESLYKKIEWLGWDTAAYVEIVATMLQNPLIQANKDEIENIEWEIRKIQENIYTVWDTARERLWSEAPEDLVSAYISQQTKQLQNQLRTAQNSLLVAQWKLDNQLSEVETLIDAINNWIKTYWTDGTWNKNYQYVSWSKYQEAWYFDKSTGQFYKLGEQPDTLDYKTDDPTRLQEIADNLTNIANSDDVYVFRDRSAFNDYFKYNKRWTAQKQVLDAFWNQYWEQLKAPAQAAWKKYQASQRTSWWTWWWNWGWSGNWWGSWSWAWTVYSNAAKNLKDWIIAWTFWWNFSTWIKPYWYKTTQEATVTMRQVWKECLNKEEFAAVYKYCELLKNTSSESWTTYNVDNLKKAVAEWYFEWYVDRNKATIKANLESKSTTNEKKQYLNTVLSNMWLWQSAKNRKAIAKAVWVDY